MQLGSPVVLDATDLPTVSRPMPTVLFTLETFFAVRKST